MNTDRERIRKNLEEKKSHACIIMLDQTEEYLPFDKDETGKQFFTRVCDLMQLEEKDYFGLIYFGRENHRLWLDNDKRLRHQLKGEDPIFYFHVKFYPPEPALVQEDLTRYQICLQLRADILSGKLPCSFITYALLGSYTAQAEFGDYNEFDHGTSYDYLKELQFAPVQDDELFKRIYEQHQRHKGQPPNVADLHFLENAKRLAMYGVHLHSALDSENVPIQIGVSASGILIYREKIRINRFAWPKVLKLSYKKKYFYVKLRPSDFDRYESTIGFKLVDYRAAKALWKISVEHHAFFRLRRPEETRKRSMFPRFNSQFRYTGTHTYHQARQLLLDRPNPDFERSLSKRTSRTRMDPREVPTETRELILPKVSEDELNIEVPMRKMRLSSSATMDSDQALLTAIRLATDLDPNKQSEGMLNNDL